MLNHLFATILICLGVANTTPISNYDQKKSNLVLTTPKKQNVVNNYSITLNETNGTYQTFNNVNVGYAKNGKDDEVKWNIAYSSNYLNVIGNKYRTTNTVNYYMDDRPDPGYYDLALYGNWETIQPNTNNVSQYARREMYILKITPYNYNVDTESRMTLDFNIENEWTDDYGDQIRIDYKKVIRNVYTSQENSWDQYIGKQIVQNTAYRITSDIEDINNGFYYNKTQEIIDITDDMYDRWEQPIPNDTFYMVIEYIFAVKASWQGASWQDYGTTYQVVPTRQIRVLASELTISGTNIIPDGTYEVVDIPSVMFEVIGMPFAFVSQAFNLTLFPGTPYQINIANLFLSIIAIFVFVWLIMLFIKKGG